VKSWSEIYEGRAEVRVMEDAEVEFDDRGRGEEGKGCERKRQIASM